MGGYPGSYLSDNVITSVLIRRGSYVRAREGNVRVEAEIGVMRVHMPRNAGAFQKLQTARGRILPVVARRNMHTLMTHFRLVTFRTVK